MSLRCLAPSEVVIVRRAMEATFQFFSRHFQTRLGVEPEEMTELLRVWPDVDDTSDDSLACLAVNNSLNEMSYGVDISEEESVRLLGVRRDEVVRVFRKWREARGQKWHGSDEPTAE